MCLGAPGQITEISGTTAIVDFWGVRREVALDVVDEEVAVGDYVLVHVGFAISRIDEIEASEIFSLLKEMSEFSESDEEESEVSGSALDPDTSSSSDP